MRKKMSYIILLLAIFGLVACAPAEFSSTRDAGTSSNGGLGIDREDLDPVDVEIVDDAEDDYENSEEVDGGDGEYNPDGPVADGEEDNHFSTDVLEACLLKLNLDQAFSGDSVSFINHRGAIKIGEVNELEMRNHRGSMRIGYAGFVHPSENLRGALVMNAGLVSTMKNLRGAMCLSVANNESFIDTRGAFVIFGRDDKDAEDDDIVKTLVDHRGSSHISKVNFDLIENTRGTITIYDSHIKELKNHRGSIKLVNSTIDSVENASGTILIDASSSIGNISMHNGKVFTN